MALVVRDCGLLEYSAALALQEELLERKIGGAADDYLLLLEHPPVYTLGRGADAEDLRGADALLGVPVFRVGRGGGVTFHGPGQLVAYPIITLCHGFRDVRRYVCGLEEVLLRVCSQFGVVGQRRAGLTGVWAGESKIASVGVGVRRWTTLHGIALNVDCDLRYFEHIVPCRMPSLRMTSLVRENAPATMADVKASFIHYFREQFAYSEGWAEATGS